MSRLKKSLTQNEISEQCVFCEKQACSKEAYEKHIKPVFGNSLTISIGVFCVDCIKLANEKEVTNG